MSRPDITEMKPADNLASEEEATKKELFNTAMNDAWEEVVRIYKENELARRVKITKSEDTAIHLAVNDGREDIVKTLVSYVTSSELEIKNELGDTPLHQAAVLGNANMCECIAMKDRKLLGILNNENETPFFLSVLHGKKEAFLKLHSLCKGNEGYSYCRRKNDGDTILHVAIIGEYFDIAFEIINLYSKLISAVNEDGLSPLHLLANKPTAFRSGSHVSGFHKLIYHCIFVDELEHQAGDHTLSKGLEYEPNAKYPENYHTCVGLVRLLRNIFWILTGSTHDTKNPKENVLKEGDEENPKEQQIATEQVESTQSLKKQSVNARAPQSDDEKGRRIFRSQGHQFFPVNYRTCFDGLKLLSKVMMIFLGLGSVEIQKIRHKKEKHIWSVQIMEKLLETAYWYEYESNGKHPQHLPSKENKETTPYYLFEGGNVMFSENFLEFSGDGDQHQPPPVQDLTKTNQTKAVADGSINDQEGGGRMATVNQKIREGEAGKALEMEKKETPLLIAAKNGVLEMVERILDLFPVAIHDVNCEKKNIVLLAVENRQPHVYKYLQDHKMKETLFRKTDKDGNSALHLAAMLRDHHPWRIPGSALQMQWEIKWYKFVKESMALHFFIQYNKAGQTPRQIFTKDHDKLVSDGGLWLTNTSQSCSVVAALIATVAFATSSTVPGGVDQHNGIPVLENQPGFSVFAISSLVALCFSVTSLVMFLSILTSRYQEKDFGKSLPRKLLIGMSSLFVSIASMLVSFCAGHFFVLKRKLQYVAFPVYAITCLPVTFFAILQFPLYFDLVLATFTKVPRRSYK